MDIALPAQETLIPVACLLLFVVLFFTRLKGMMEISMLRNLTELTGPITDVNPRPVYSKQYYVDAAKSVQHALSHNFRATNWSIKVLQMEDPIEKSIRVVGNSNLGPSLVHTPNTAQSDPARAAKSMPITVNVDVHQVPNGSRITWKYIPADPSEFQRRVQMNDRNLILLLGRTNYSLIKHLHAKKALH